MAGTSAAQSRCPPSISLLTFTLPARAQSRWHGSHQRTLYALMTRCSWETVRTFSPQRQATAGDARCHNGPAHPLAASGLPPACAFGDARRGHRWRKKAVAHQRRQKSQIQKAGPAICSTTRPWPRSFAPNCSTPSATRDSSYPRRHPETWVVDVRVRRHR